MTLSFCFFFNDTATTEIYTLSLHDALPICRRRLAVHAGHRHRARPVRRDAAGRQGVRRRPAGPDQPGSGLVRRDRSEEHTSELQSRQYLVCRLLLEKKKKKYTNSLNLIKSR